MKFAYLLVNLFSVIVPFAFSFHSKIKFTENFRYFFKANLLVSLLFIIWDMLFTANHVWSFNSSYILGLTIYNLPLEEILFFVCIPFACIFTYHCFTLYLKWEWNAVLEKYFVPSFSLVLLLIGIMNLQKDYTSVTFISCALFLLALKYYFNAHWLQQFLIVYLFLLLPFFIVNGILTGTGIEHPVVMYNNAENLGIRLLTIPVEDIFYGMEMLLLNAFFYERFKSSQ